MGFNDLNNGGGPGSSGYGPVPTPIYQYLDTNGDGSGTTNANGDYSASQEIFYIQPSSTQIIRLERMLVLVGGRKNDFFTDSYGGIAAGLTNGITVRVQDDSETLVTLTAGIPIKTNADWGGLCFDAEVYPSANGNVDSYLRVRWTFTRSGYPLRLNGANNERLEIVLNDNFSGDSGGTLFIRKQLFHVQGYVENTT